MIKTFRAVCQDCAVAEELEADSRQAAERTFRKSGWTERGRPERWVCRFCSPVPKKSATASRTA